MSFLVLVVVGIVFTLGNNEAGVTPLEKEDVVVVEVREQ